MKIKFYSTVIILSIALISSAQAAIQCPSAKQLNQESMTNIDLTELLIDEIRFNTPTKNYGTDVAWHVQVIVNVKGPIYIEDIEPAFNKAKNALNSLSLFLQDEISGRAACTYITDNAAVFLSAVQKAEPIPSLK